MNLLPLDAKVEEEEGGHPYKIFMVQLPGWCQAEMEPAQKIAQLSRAFSGRHFKK